MAEIIEKDLSYRIVKAAYEVFNGLGPGFAEDIYEEAMVINFGTHRLQVARVVNTKQK